MSEQSLKELLRGIPSAVLDQQCSDRFLADVAGNIVNWQTLAPYFNISRGEKHSIRESCSVYDEQKQEFLFKWKENNPGATHGALLEAIHSSNNMELLHNACDLLKQISCQGKESSMMVNTISPLLLEFQAKLKRKYSTHKPIMVTEWPPPCSMGYVKLVLVPKKKIARGEIKNEEVYAKMCQSFDEAMDTSEEVDIDQLLALDTSKHQVILFEGPPGSGKSTLLWHICQSWQSGQQFQHFSLVLLVQLKDPAFHTAKSLAGLVPFPSQGYSEKVASEIEEIEGERVLILLDGWDEAPAELREKGSFFHDLIAKPCDWGIEKAVVVVSSRPLASDRLWMYLSDRVELRGFTEEMREKYIKEALEDSPDAAQSLIDEIESIEGSDAMDLTLPLTIASLVHIYSASGGELPPTPCRIAIMVVLSILFRHIQKTCPGGKSVKALKSFEDLPQPACRWFHHLCKIAYDGIVNEKFSFTDEELIGIEGGGVGSSQPMVGETGGDKLQVATLGLLQPLHSLVSIGSSTVYHFLHLSHQELCAAYHVSRLPDPEKTHVDALNAIVTLKPRQFDSFQAVCKFFSALTGMRIPCIAEMLVTIYFLLDNSGMYRVWRDESYSSDESDTQSSEGSGEPGVEWGHDHMLFTNSDAAYVAKVGNERWYWSTSFLEFVMESMNPEFIDSSVGKQIKAHIDRETEGLFAAIVGMAHSLESVTYYMHSVSPRMFNALRNKQNLKTFVLYVFRVISDCTDFEAMNSALPTCPHLEEVYIRVRFSDNVSHLPLIAETFRHIELKKLDIDTQNSIEAAGLAALAPAFVTTSDVRIRCKEVGPLGLERLKDAVMQSTALSYLEINIDIYGGEDREFFGCLRKAPSVKTVALFCKDRGIMPHDGEPSLIDSAVGRVLLSGDLVELAQIFGLNDRPTVDKTLHVHIFNSCLEIDFKNEYFKSVSLVECQHKDNRGFERDPIEIRNRIDLNGVRRLCTSLQSIAVEELNLSAHSIGDRGAICFKEAIPAVICLKELIIRECEIGEDGIASVFAGLTKNETLTTLDAAYNKFGDSGAIQIAKLINQTSLEVLDIDSCGVGEEGMVAIAASLRTNTTLRKLSLYSKDQAITQCSEVELSRMLIENRTLLLLEVNQNDDFYWSRIHRNEISRNFRVSHATLQTLLMDIDPEECYHAIKVSPIIARIGVESTSPLGQALIWDNMELAADILQLDQPPAAQGRVELKVDDDNVWRVNYSEKRVIEYRKQLKKESQEVVGGEGKQGVEGEGEKAKDEEGGVVAGKTEVNKHASPVDEA